MFIFKNFKGFSEVAIDSTRPLTVLVGANGSGKSNLIEGLELFAFLAAGHPLHEVADVGRRESGLQIRGGLQGCPTYGHDRFSFGFAGRAQRIPSLKRGDRMLYYIMDVVTNQRSYIARESLEWSSDIIFESTEEPREETSADNRIKFKNFRPGRDPIARVASDRSALSQYSNFAVQGKEYKSCQRLVDFVIERLTNLLVFDPRPKLMRAYERIGNRELSRDGSNLSAVLYYLHQQGDGEGPLGNLVKRIKQLPEEPFASIEFVTTPLEDVILGFKREENGELVDARSLSDGTLRALSVLTALETVPPRSRLVVEEFDNGVHPSRVNVLIEAIIDAAERRGLKVLVTTHNPASLNALPEEHLDGVYVCSWNHEEKSASVTPLKDIPRSDQLLATGRLGDWVTRRVLERHLASDFEQRHQERMEEWLGNLP